MQVASKRQGKKKQDSTTGVVKRTRIYGPGVSNPFHTPREWAEYICSLLRQEGLIASVLEEINPDSPTFILVTGGNYRRESIQAKAFSIFHKYRAIVDESVQLKFFLADEFYPHTSLCAKRGRPQYRFRKVAVTE